MKKLISYAAILLCLAACNSNQFGTPGALINGAKPVTPAPLLTPAGQSWKVAPLKTTGYGSIEKTSYKTKKDTAGKLIKAKFETGGGFNFTYTGRNENREFIITVEGKAVFETNKDGKNIFVLQPAKGTRFVNNNEIPLSAKELKENFSARYQWEKINFPGMPAEDFLLLADLTTCSAGASIKDGSIDKACVYKFYTGKE